MSLFRMYCSHDLCVESYNSELNKKNHCCPTKVGVQINGTLNMKKIIIMLGFAGMLYTHNVKHTKMKDYVFIMRLEAITPEVEAQVLPKWAVLIPQWIAQGHLVDNLVIANEGTLFSGKGRAISHAPINNNGQ